ncbi:putative bifunctional diguanylate cyclase/phosphodiesterase [Sphingomonas adhaesiva]|uniref:putative bifunctional diguanylate cyclase/phosphodiesterase n=1 Tax=Sphingomonas adhaesiva TaxID=28212 RepID=UPI002FF7E240
MRILIVDDEPTVHDGYRLALSPPPASAAALSAMAGELFGDLPDAPPHNDDAPVFDTVHHLQGLDAVAEVERALAAGDPFRIAFIDVRMPPGIDGRDTARRIRALDPDIQIVIVTGYSDFSLVDIARVAGPVDKLFYIAKPFEVGEVAQLAASLGKRWGMDRALRDAHATLARQLVQLEQQAAELAANERRALHVASHDSLTEAPNRVAFQRALHERVRRPGAFAVAMLDLDRFKQVNDTMGHLAGDALLRAVCRQLQDALPEGGMVARLGGDEFGLLYDTQDQASGLATADALVAACSTTVTIFGQSVRGAASMGLIVADPAGGNDAVHLLRRADLALNDAKRHGRNCARLFDRELDENVRLRQRIEKGLSRAIERCELSLAFQPIVSGAAHEIVGFETLLRWNTREHGPVSPAIFIPIAEESNLIHELGDWVLERSLMAVKRFPGQYVSVNVSPRQFRRQNFVADIRARVERAGVDPARIQIEITETAIFDDAEGAARTLDQLRALGFRIALDDFGTGYSSLYNIRTFALDTLKIDRSFIEGMPRERESLAIVRSIIHLAHSLGLNVVAEGVETQAHVDLLRAAGASHLQGAFFSCPVTAAQAIGLAHRRWLAGTGMRPTPLARTGTDG